VEHGTFAVFSATGGMADQAVVFYKHLASLISEKRDDHYGVVMGCCLSFSVLRSAIHCIRGSRSSASRFTHAENPIDLRLGFTHYMTNFDNLLLI